MNLSIQPLTREHILDFLSWEYAAPYDQYNMQTENEGEAVDFFADPANEYFGIVTDAGDLLGFCNLGIDAQVPGGTYKETAVDVGMGLRPELTGQGEGHRYAEVVFAHARQLYPERPLRVTIAEFNKRAQRLCARHGFSVTASFEKTTTKQPFVIMISRESA